MIAASRSARPSARLLRRRARRTEQQREAQFGMCLTDPRLLACVMCWSTSRIFGIRLNAWRLRPRPSTRRPIASASAYEVASSIGRIGEGNTDDRRTPSRARVAMSHARGPASGSPIGMSTAIATGRNARTSANDATTCTDVGPSSRSGTSATTQPALAAVDAGYTMPNSVRHGSRPSMVMSSRRRSSHRSRRQHEVQHAIRLVPSHLDVPSVRLVARATSSRPATERCRATPT